MTDNQLVPLDQWGKAASVFKESPVDASKFTSGIGMAWPTLTIKGKNWGWRFRGVDHTYTAPNAAAGGALMPVQFLDVVIVDAGNRISKVYYKAGYKDGERTPPTCWSADGVTPDGAASEKQSNTCGGCRHNVFGSSIGPAGQRGKACSDNKRLAIVTGADLANTDFGGAFMLRLPPGSFSNYTTYCSVMASRGFQPYEILTRLTFDNTPHPKLLFQPVRPLTDAEGKMIVVHQKNPRTGEMLNDKAVAAFADGAAEVEDAPAELPSASASGDGGGQPDGWGAPATGGGTTPPPSTPPVAAAAPAAPKPTPEQLEIQALKAALAAAEKAPEPALTPEQLEIQALKAKLAEVEAAKKARKPRAKPVGPPLETTPVTPAGNGVADEAAPSRVGNAIADRIAGLVGKS